jgi:hypothetical protein
VFISKLNGHPVDDEVRANEELERLTNRLWNAVSDAGQAGNPRS